eukprot:scaffold28779_cov66-Phaeocystis_antarctica.AAC.4
MLFRAALSPLATHRTVESTANARKPLAALTPPLLSLARLGRRRRIERPPLAPLLSLLVDLAVPTTMPTPLRVSCGRGIRWQPGPLRVAAARRACLVCLERVRTALAALKHARRIVLGLGAAR